MRNTSRFFRGSLFGQPLLNVVQNHLISYPTPSNLTGSWNWGVLAGLCLVLQIVTGIFLAMHYTAHVDYAFHSVQHLMRDVPNGWLLRYLHLNGLSLFFIVVYMHLFRGLYFTSYAQPREAVWLIGVIILLLMILTRFIGYVLPWGLMYLARDDTRVPTQAFIHYSFYLVFLFEYLKFHIIELLCCGVALIFNMLKFSIMLLNSLQSNTDILLCIFVFAGQNLAIYRTAGGRAPTPKEGIGPLRLELNRRVDPFFTPRLLSHKRVGPHRFEVLRLLFGLLIGDLHREYRSGSTRITLHCSSKNVEYLYWIHDQLSQFGYCNQSKPSTLTKQYCKKNGETYFSMKLHTWQFQSFNFIREAWYTSEGVKIIPDCLEMFLTEMGLALLLMDDLTKLLEGGILILTYGFDSESCLKLQLMLERKFQLTLTSRVNPKGQYTIYFPKDQMNKIIGLVLPYFCDSMLYKLGLTPEQAKALLASR